jgi:hypothetical protein
VRGVLFFTVNAPDDFNSTKTVHIRQIKEDKDLEEFNTYVGAWREYCLGKPDWVDATIRSGRATTRNQGIRTKGKSTQNEFPVKSQHKRKTTKRKAKIKKRDLSSDEQLQEIDLTDNSAAVSKYKTKRKKFDVPFEVNVVNLQTGVTYSVWHPSNHEWTMAKLIKLDMYTNKSPFACF